MTKTKRSLDDLACFGGAPLFDEPLPIGQLALPDRDAFFAHAEAMFKARRFTNNGPLAQRLERELAALHEVPHCIAFGNASLAIIVLLHVLADGRRGEVIMPAFTYVGLPHLARWAGQFPRFCDVDADRHTLDVAAVAAAIGPQTTSILGVHQVNAPCPIDELDALSRKHGVPVVYDAVHGIACSHGGRPIGGFGAAEVFSLHATKILNGFEGGYVTTHDAALADALRLARNFGFTSETDIAALGMNAKLNEVHAACALAGIAGLGGIVERNRQRVEDYRAAFSGIPGLSWLDYDVARLRPDDKRNYEFALLRIPGDWPLARDQVVDAMRAEGALGRAYYSPALHRSSHCPPGAETSLPVTERLSTQYIQMPVGERVGRNEVTHLAELFAFLHAHGAAIASRLGARA